jgi:transposase InsO family protein
MKKAGVWKSSFDELFGKMYDNCQICKQFKKTPARPVVAMPMAKEFNEAVCMDLKKWKNLWILHIIDMYSRYTRSIPVSRKFSSSRNFRQALQNWVSIFGVMKKLLTDNGGEFTAEETREVSSHLNIVKFTTAAEAPWQNGLCERVHQVTDMILSKLCTEHHNVSLDVLVGWANISRYS